MAEYRVEWQMGGETRISISDDATGVEIQNTVERVLEGISEDTADDIATDLDAGIVSYSTSPATATIAKVVT